MFADREEEIGFLDRAWTSDRAELIVVYGRRRVGKTALLHAFCASRPHTFWVASLSSDGLLRRSFTQALWESTHPEAPDAGFTYDSWERGFLALVELAQSERHVVVIDEFPYLAHADPSVPSVLQKVWDQRLQHSRLMLVLCGSHIGMMEQEVLLYRAPLYGRRTGQLLVQPLPLRAVAAFFPSYPPVEQIEIFAVLGGIPAYLTQFEERESLIGNIQHHVLNPGSYLYLEAQFLLREELREPRNYFAILQAIAQGRTRLNEIAQATGIGRQPASRYLDVLRDLGVVERVVPVTERQPEKSRRGIYRLGDPFLRFWFRFVAPNFSRLEAGQTASVVQTVAAELPAFVGPAFEEICRHWIVARGAEGRLPVAPERVGAWWGPGEEIDVVAVGRETALFGECKWTARPVGTNVLDDLKRKAHPLIVGEGFRRVFYALFSRSGFTPGLEGRARDEGVLLVGAPELTGREAAAAG